MSGQDDRPYEKWHRQPQENRKKKRIVDLGSLNFSDFNCQWCILVLRKNVLSWLLYVVSLFLICFCTCARVDQLPLFHLISI